MGVDPETLALNFMLIIGALLVGGAALIVLVAVWTLVKAAWWSVAQHRSWRRHVEKRYRADGVRFPNSGEGSCMGCRRWDRCIYYAEPGLDLCPGCYDRHWRASSQRSAAPQP